MNEQELETLAQLSAQRFLLEILYANAFKGDAAGFDRIMTELIRLTHVESTAAGPIANEDEAQLFQEIQARLAAHLQRFSYSVQQRLASRRAV